MRLLLSLEAIHKCKVILIGVRHFRSAGASMIFPFCQPQSYLPGTGCTAITKAVGPEWGLSIALRLGWPLRSPQMLVTRVRNFYVGGTAFALSPEKKKNNCSYIDWMEELQNLCAQDKYRFHCIMLSRRLCVYLCQTSKKTFKVLNTIVWPNNSEKENSKSQRYMVFPSGHPSKY